jgi:hypothetical protein
MILKITRRLSKIFVSNKIPKNRQSDARVVGRPRLLVIGIYLAGEVNYAEELVQVFTLSKDVDVEQRWVSMNGPAPGKAIAAVTVRQLDTKVPKWQIVNELISSHDLQAFDYFLICDDDVLLASDFVDRFIAEQQSLDFALAQPARTWRSYTDHPIVRRRLLTRARQTNFVEIGPVVSFRRDFMALVYPFSLESPMGWGYDYVWPVIADDHGLTIGIVDGVPVDHSLRASGTLYNKSEQNSLMFAYLSRRPHVRPKDVLSIRTYR